MSRGEYPHGCEVEDKKTHDIGVVVRVCGLRRMVWFYGQQQAEPQWRYLSELEPISPAGQRLEAVEDYGTLEEGDKVFLPATILSGCAAKTQLGGRQIQWAAPGLGVRRGDMMRLVPAEPSVGRAPTIAEAKAVLSEAVRAESDAMNERQLELETAWKAIKGLEG